MTDYVNTFGAASKDANNDIITASDIGTELDNAATAIATKADKAVPTSIGNVALLTSTGNLSDGGQGLPTGTIVGTTDTQTLTNKTLTSPVINSGTLSGNFTVGATTISATEVSYLDGVSSNIQTQLNSVVSDGEFRNLRVYTSSATWTKPAGIKRVEIIHCIGAGGAGGGVSGGPGGDFTGGHGGQGGYGSGVIIEAASLGSTETVTIGVGGVHSDVPPRNGGNGGSTSFGIHCTSTGGAGGTGGTLASGSDGADGSFSGGLYSWVGGPIEVGLAIDGVTPIGSGNGSSGTGYGAGGGGGHAIGIENRSGADGIAGLLVLKEYY